MSTADRIGRSSRLHNLLRDLGFRPYNQFSDSASLPAPSSGLADILPADQFELASLPGWQGVAGTRDRVSQDYHVSCRVSLSTDPRVRHRDILTRTHGFS